MNRDEFELLAKKAGIAKHGLGWTAWESQLERFAELIVERERNECAKVCEQRKPLTEEEIAKILDRERMKWATSPPTYEFALAFARAIEKAHGIGGEG